MSEPLRKSKSPHAASQIKLKDIARQLQMLMLDEGITPEELVSCAKAVKDSYDNVPFAFESALSPEERMCHFCQRTTQQVKILIAGPGVNICDKCVHTCSGMLEKHSH